METEQISTQSSPGERRNQLKKKKKKKKKKSKTLQTLMKIKTQQTYGTQ